MAYYSVSFLHPEAIEFELRPTVLGVWIGPPWSDLGQLVQSSTLRLKMCITGKPMMN